MSAPPAPHYLRTEEVTAYFTKTGNHSAGVLIPTGLCSDSTSFFPAISHPGATPHLRLETHHPLIFPMVLSRLNIPKFIHLHSFHSHSPRWPYP